jgi:hypothetical protein
MFANVVPPLVLCCHCTVGVGLPLAAAVNVAVAPDATVTLVGFVVTTGAEVTVSVANDVEVVSKLLVNRARYSLPFCDAFAVKDNVVEVAPAIFVNVPLAGACCHCTVGVGFPLAAAVKVAIAPDATVASVGLVVIVGGNCTVSVAAVLVAVLTLFVNTARYRLPFCDEVSDVSDSVVEVAPETFVNVVPPSMLTCHCTVGVGVPLAAAANNAVPPALPVVFVGLVVTTGAVFTVSVAAVLVTELTLFVKTA